MQKYFYSYNFKEDIVIFICIIFQIFNVWNGPLLYIGKIIICIKLKNVSSVQSYLEITFIKN
jgi:hypothetical protein